MNTKKMFCEFCGNKVYSDAVICPSCGRQIAELKYDKGNVNPQVVINNSNQINGPVGYCGKSCDKWVAFLLCFFLGTVGAHKFYEGKTGMGIIYILTFDYFLLDG